MKLFVTGGAGFIGSSVVRHILQFTDFRVVNIDSLTYAGNLESLKIVTGNQRYQFEKIDICDVRALNHAFQKHQPSAVMHLAAESHVDRSIDWPDNFIGTNIVGTYNLLQESIRYFRNLSEKNKVDFRFHHISTDEVFGDLKNTKQLFTEKSIYAPSSPYSASKASSDHLVRAWGRTYGLPVIITHCSNNYGPYHFPEKFIPHIIINALKGNVLPIYGDGTQIRDWLYVEDHANALLKVIEGGRIGETYNIGGNNEKKNLDVVEAICSLLEELAPQKPPKVRRYHDLIRFMPDRPGHDMRYAVDSSKIQQELGWSPKETFTSGLRKTVQWYLDNPEWWQRVLSGEYKLERLGSAT